MRQLLSDVIRKREYHPEWQFYGSSCRWCGLVCRTKAGRAYLYRYGTLSPMLRQSWDGEKFCCKSCRDAYHV